MHLLERWRAASGRYRNRMIAGLLVVSLPITIVLAVLLTRKASGSLTSTSGQSAAQLARAVSIHLEDFLSERHENLALIAQEASGGLAAQGSSRHDNGRGPRERVPGLCHFLSTNPSSRGTKKKQRIED